MGRKKGTFEVQAVDETHGGGDHYSNINLPGENGETLIAEGGASNTEVERGQGSDLKMKDEELNEGNPKDNAPVGDIEMKVVVNNHIGALQSGSPAKSKADTPNTTRKRRKNLQPVEDLNMAEVISMSGVESLCTISNYDAMSTKDADGDEEEEEEGEQGLGVHHVLSVILALASVTVILLLYFLLPCPCEPQDWSVELPSVVSTSPVRLQDVNRDGMDDIIFGYDYDLDYHSVEEMNRYCNEMNMTAPCGRGIQAVSGWRGKVLWEVPTNQTITGLLCNQLDVNRDGRRDCLATGYNGQILAIDTKSGEVLWEADPSVTIPTWSYYQPQVLADDLDGDKIPDVVATHGHDVNEDGGTGAGRLILLSGGTGDSIGSFLEMPDGMATRCPPILYREVDDADSAPYVVFGSGTATTDGSMWMAKLEDVLCHVTGSDDCSGQMSAENGDRLTSGRRRRTASNSSVPAVELVRGIGSGFELPAVVADMTLDGVKDLVIASSDARITVINGTDHKEVWMVDQYSDSYRVISVLAPGHFNEDDVPDVLVHLSADGQSAVIQDKTVILDGRTGEELWHTVSTSSNLSPLGSSPLSLEAEKQRDAFIFWLSSVENSGIATTTRADEADGCSDFDATLSTLSLMMMDRDMTFSPAILTSSTSSVYFSNSSSNIPTFTMTSMPVASTGSGHVTSIMSTDASRTTVLDVTSIVATKLASSPSSLNATLPSSSGGRRRRDAGSTQQSGGCYQRDPFSTSTGAIGDFDNDGTLELIAAINLISTEEGRPSSHLALRRFGLKEALDQNGQIKLTGGNTYLNPSMDNSSVSGNLYDHFSLREEKEQSWMGFLGTAGDGNYS